MYHNLTYFWLIVFNKFILLPNLMIYVWCCHCCGWISNANKSRNIHKDLWKEICPTNKSILKVENEIDLSE